MRRLFSLGSLPLVLLLALGNARDARADEGADAPAPAPAPSPDQHIVPRGIALTGARYGRVFGVNMESVQLGLGLEAHGGPLGVLVLPEVDLGRTFEGVKSGRVGLTGALEGNSGRFGLGGGFLVVYDWLGGGNAVGAGVTVLARLDVVRFEKHRALVVMLRGDATEMQGLGGGGDHAGRLATSLSFGARF